MEAQQYDYGMIGLGTMGRNLALNMADHGFTTAGLDKDETKAKNLGAGVDAAKVCGTTDVKTFVQSLKMPRTIILLVPAGAAVDAVVDELKPYLSKEDLVMDFGNSHFTDTAKRVDALQKEGLHFMGVGISGGEWGARNGASIMPGGDKAAYDRVAPMLKAVSAKVDGEPCVTYLGPGAAGHYVKMVHNGIEYAIMQMIAETYHILKTCVGLSNKELADLFKKWNEGGLNSFLIEITATVFAQEDDITKDSLVDKILDRAQQKGTGQWTSQSAMDLGTPIPGIDASVAARNLSALKDERIAAANILSGPSGTFAGTSGELIDWLHNALQFAMMTTYAQGIALLGHASKEYKYELNLDDIAAIWRGGCIIRAAFLEDIRKAYAKETPANLMVSDIVAPRLVSLQDDIRLALATAIKEGIPVPVLSASLAYFDSYRAAWLPANLIQGQRDFFGAHTYQRTDREGTFHTEWNQKTA